MEKRIAVLFNASSSKDINVLEAVGSDLLRLFQGFQVLSIEGYGSRHVPGSTVLPAPVVDGYIPRLQAAVRALLEYCPDYVITVGGDGLASYVAGVILHSDVKTIMFGVGCGTANVGPVVSVSPDELAQLELANLSVVAAMGIRVMDGNEQLGYGFNDVILGDTLLATVGEKTTNVSAVLLASEGKIEEKRPGTRIASSEFLLKKNNQHIFYGNSSEIGQIIVAPLQFDRLYGRAIMGALCQGGYDSTLAAVAISDRPLVSCFDPEMRFHGLVPVNHLLFSQGDEITITGLGADAQIIIDGNPYVRKTDTVRFSVGEALSIVRPRYGKEV